jgi:hypothetical protein
MTRTRLIRKLPQLMAIGINALLWGWILLLLWMGL